MDFLEFTKSSSEENEQLFEFNFNANGEESAPSEKDGFNFESLFDGSNQSTSGEKGNLFMSEEASVAPVLKKPKPSGIQRERHVKEQRDTLSPSKANDTRLEMKRRPNICRDKKPPSPVTISSIIDMKFKHPPPPARKDAPLAIKKSDRLEQGSKAGDVKRDAKGSEEPMEKYQVQPLVSIRDSCPESLSSKSSLSDIVVEKKSGNEGELMAMLNTEAYKELQVELRKLEGSQSGGNFTTQVATSVESLFKSFSKQQELALASLSLLKEEMIDKVNAAFDQLTSAAEQGCQHHKTALELKLNDLSELLDQIKTAQFELQKFRNLLKVLNSNLNSEP